jgi:hypothetical protein
MSLAAAPPNSADAEWMLVMQLIPAARRGGRRGRRRQVMIVDVATLANAQL